MNYPLFTINTFSGGDFATHSLTAQCSLHYHDYFEISYLIKGTAIHKTLTTEETLGNDTLIILRPNDIHFFNEIDASVSYHRDILIDTNLFKNTCDSISPTLFDSIISQKEFIKIPLRKNELEISESNLDFYSTISESDEKLKNSLKRIITEYILLLYIKNQHVTFSSVPEWYIKLQEVLNNPTVLKVGIDAILKEMGYSHGHLCRLIKQYTGKKILDILTESRMNQAAILLKTTNMSTLDIAAQVGYESFSHFICVFKKTYRLSPYQYKKNQKVLTKKEK